MQAALALQPSFALPPVTEHPVLALPVITEQPALDPWEALVSGVWSLLGYEDTGDCRLVLARRNGPGSPGRPPLTMREQRAALLAVLGHANKQIGFELGVATSTAWSLVAMAMRKLGVRSRVELVQLFGPMARSHHAASHHAVRAERPRASCFERDGNTYLLLTIPLRSLEPPACLTKAEREVVRGVLEKKSNAEIALARHTSVHTVANQLRAVYLKLGISGRSQLLASC